MPNKKLGLIAILVSVAAGPVWAGTLASYSTGDVLLCFRRSGGGANDLVVDAGPISSFTNAAPNSRISITQYNGDQLALIGTNGVGWSAFTYFDNTVAPNWALCMTRARAGLNTQTAPWPANSASAQQYVIVSEISTIPVGANDNLLYDGVNTTAAVVEPDSSTSQETIGNYPNGQAYHTALDPNGGGDNNFGGFYGSPENTTPAGFTTAGQATRSDFYWIPPTGAGAVKYLGYFELNTNGAMSYVAYPTAVPILTKISRSGNVNTLTYKTGIYGAYSLLGTHDVSAAPSTWPVITTLTAGDNSTHTYPDTQNTNVMFYIIQGQ